MRVRVISGVVAVTASVLLATLAPAVAVADGPLKVQLRLGSSCVTGHKPTDQPVTVKLLRSDGTTIATRHDSTTQLEWKVCFTKAPVHGNKLRLANGTFQRTVSIPDLTISLDRVTNVVRGHAPAGATIDLGYSACNALGQCIESPPVPATANSQGRYRQDLSPIDIDGSDVVAAGYTNSHDDVFVREGQAPFMVITKPNGVSVKCMPAGTTTVRLLTSSGALRAKATFHISKSCGAASGSFRAAGHAVNIHVGDRIRADFASDARMTWPGVSVAAKGFDYSLHCFPDTDWYFSIFNTKGVLKGSYSGTTDSNGRFAQEPGYQNIKEGWTVRVACESKPGDRVIAKAKAKAAPAS